MNRRVDTGGIWDNVWRNPDGWYPNEFVVRFFAKHVRRRCGLDAWNTTREDIHRVLDLGCGCGRHVVMLAREGYEAFGFDVSIRAIGFAKEWLDREGLTAELEVGSGTALPWPDRHFDAVIAAGVLDHMCAEDASRVVAETARVLRPGGLLYASFASIRESGFGQGEKIDEYTYRIPDGMEKGTVQRFYDSPHVAELLNDQFALLDVVHEEWQSVRGKGFSALDRDDEYPRLARLHVAAERKAVGEEMPT